MDLHDRIEPLATPTCRACGVAMEVSVEAATGRVVRVGGRAMMRCSQCGDVVVSHDPVRDRRRVRLFNGLVSILFGLGLFVFLLDRFLRMSARNISGLPPQWWVKTVLLVFLPSAMFYFTLAQFMSAIHPRNKEYVVERWVSALLMLGIFVVLIWMIIESGVSRQLGHPLTP